MATSAPSVTFLQTTDAEFRAWGSAVSGALSAVGLTQTSDTGQINWASVSKPSAGNTAQGYEVWRFNDTLQASKPLFMKIEYGSSASGATYPAVWVTFGMSTDGAGSITGSTIIARTQRTFTPSATPLTAYFCYNTAISALWFYLRSSSGFGFFVLHRTCDADETPNSDGVLAVNTSAALGTANMVLWRFDTQSAVSNYNGLWSFPITLASTTVLNTGSSTSVFPGWGFISRVTWFPMFLGCTLNDFQMFTTMSVTPYSTARTYMALTAPSACPYGTDSGSSTYSRGLWVYE